MPTYKITDNETGRTYKVTGDSPPTEAEAMQIFASQVSKNKSGVPKLEQKPVNTPKKTGYWDGVKSRAGEVVKNNKEYYQAIAHHAQNIPLGLGQTTANVGAYIGDKFGASKDGFLNTNADSYNDFMRDREAEYQAKVPDSVASYSGAVVGEVAPWLIPQTGIPKLMGAIDKGAKAIAGGGALGRILSRTGQGVASIPFVPAVGDDYGSEKALQTVLGATLPHVLPIASGAIRAGGSAYNHLANPQAIADELIARNIPATPENIAKLRASSQYGYNPTTARAMDGSLTPEQNARLASAEKSLRNNKEYNGMFAGRDAENNANRLAIVNKIAQADNPNALTEAKAARRQAVAPFLNEHMQPVPANELERSRAIAKMNLELLKPTEYPESQYIEGAKFKETPTIGINKNGAKELQFDMEKDDFRVWLASKGGVTPEVLQFIGVDQKAWKGGRNNVVVGAHNNSVVRKDGMNQGRLLEAMQEDGWIPPEIDGMPANQDESGAFDILSNAIHGGNKQYHPDSGSRYVRQEESRFVDDYNRDVADARDIGTTPEQFQRSADIVDSKRNGDVFEPNLPANAGARGSMVSPTEVMRVLKNLSISSNTVVSNAAKSQLNIIRQNLDGNGNISVEALDGVRRNVKDTLNQATNKPQGAGNSEKAIYAPVASQIIRSINKEVPGYGDYLRTYADKSRGVNTIEAGRDILATLRASSRDSSGNSQLTLNQSKLFNKQLDKKRYGIEPESRDALRYIHQTQLQDSTTNGALGINNSATEFNRSNRLGNLFFGDVESGKTGMLGRLIGAGAGGAMGGGGGAMVGLATAEAVSNFVNGRIMKQYAQGMLSPQDASLALERILAKNPKQAKELLIKNPAWRTLLALPRQDEKALDAGFVTPLNK